LGYVTLKFTPDVTSIVLYHKNFCLEVGENCSPTIDHCIIRSESVEGAAVCVSEAVSDLGFTIVMLATVKMLTYMLLIMLKEYLKITKFVEIL